MSPSKSLQSARKPQRRAKRSTKYSNKTQGNAYSRQFAFCLFCKTLLSPERPSVYSHLRHSHNIPRPQKALVDEILKTQFLEDEPMWLKHLRNETEPGRKIFTLPTDDRLDWDRNRIRRDVFLINGGAYGLGKNRKH